MKNHDLEKQYKKYDLMLSMHSTLRDSFRRRSRLLERFLVIGSALLMGTTFLSPDDLEPWNIEPKWPDLALKISAILLFLGSLLALISNWKARYKQHEVAAKALSVLKSKARSLRQGDSTGEQSIKEFLDNASLIVDDLIPIPNHLFPRLKSKHHRKIAISKMISAHPGSSVRLISVLVWWRSNVRAISKKAGAHDGADIDNSG